MIRFIKKFQKQVENFVCEKCRTAVVGNGYTNHCPNCLYSKHVDNNPGDRANTCGGMMKPVRMETQKGEFVIVHKCLKCGLEKRNKSASNDKLY